MKISDEIRKWCGICRDSCIDEDDCDKLRDLADRIDNEMVELPRDMDGAPIHIGDTVCDPSGSECTVISLHLYGEEAPSWMADVNICAYGQTVTARRGQSELTHKLPDSWERIADELDEHRKTLANACKIDADEEDTLHDLADRIRRLAEKEAER